MSDKDLKNQHSPAGESDTSAELGLPGVEGGSWEWKYNDLRKRMENHLLFEIDILTAKIKREERAGSNYELVELHQIRNKVNEILQYMYAVTCDEKLNMDGVILTSNYE